jgi:hypothetical protein
VYIGENAAGAGAVSVFQPKSGGGYQEASYSPITEDAAGNIFGDIGSLANYSLILGDYILVGNTGSTFLYQAPLTKSSTPVYKLSESASCTTAPLGPTGYSLFVGGGSSGGILSSALFIANYYTGNAIEYNVVSFLAGSACPTPIAETSSIASSYPEGVAVDVFGNLFVSYSGTSSILVYEAPYTGSPVLTVH